MPQEIETRERADDGRVRWWLWPNTLSLDAPVVAMLWLGAFAREWGVDGLGWRAYAALGLAVWAIYVVDRLLDGWLRRPGDPLLGERHAFHARHRRWFAMGVLAACGWLAWWVVDGWPLDGLVVAVMPVVALVAVFFAVVAMLRGRRGVPYTRNGVAGLAFGMGTALQAHVATADGGLPALLSAPEVLGFALLCALNINAIHGWERERLTEDRGRPWERMLAVVLPLVVLVALGWWVFPAVVAPAVLLLVLDGVRRHLPLDALRVLADAALLAPLWVRLF